MSFEPDFSKSYDDRSKEYIDDVDFQKLADVRSKELTDITEDDLSSIGFVKVKQEEFDELYFYEDLNGIKVYVSRDNNKFELRGYQLRKEKDIDSTAELLDETFKKWRLKIKNDGKTQI